jgi:hypothetical protein
VDVITPISRRERFSLFLLSAATLIFEINLTRLFSVAQFYHFAFLVVSLALLGFGAAGSFLASFNWPRRTSPGQALGWLSLLAGLSMLGAYLLVNWLPFDSFSIAWDTRQVALLALNCLALSAPFFFSGLAVGLLLSTDPGQAGRTYAANLTGSACGCALALLAPAYVGGEGIVVLSSGAAALAGLASCAGFYPQKWSIRLGALALLAFAVIDLGLRLGGEAPLPWLRLRLSPYKSLSYALQYPDAELVWQRWNSISRLDVVRSPGIRSYPGLSYRYQQALPAEDGLLVDGDELSPVLRPGYSTDFFRYLPAAIAYELRPGRRVLVLEPHGGLDVLAALELGAGQVTAVEANPLILEAADSVYGNPRLSVFAETERTYLRRSDELFDVIVLSLASSYHPVRSGAYSLSEDYRYTVEAFEAAYARLDTNGLLVVTRWLQTPPSEELRTFALAVTALEDLGANPRRQIVAMRGYNTATLLVRKGPFKAGELQAIRAFASERAFDLIYASDIQPGETNRNNRLPEPVYYQSFMELLNARPRSKFYAAYPYEVSPPTDDRPFFSHYFKWSQAGQVWAELGKTWQPFGGAGYFVILALLALASLLAGVLILLPAAMARLPGLNQSAQTPGRLPSKDTLRLAYFGMIGLAYLLVEIPLLQRFILFLGHPAYAMAVILFSLLLFSGLGSLASQRVVLPASLAALVVLLLILPVLLSPIFELALGWGMVYRLGLTALLLAPVGFLMGTAFPGGIDRLLASGGKSRLIPWAWAVNGAASVIASVLAALLALSFGFSWVLRLGALLYAAACIIVILTTREGKGNSDPPARSG